MFAVNVKPDLRPLQRAFIDLHAKQVPFATALALTRLAKGVEAVENAEVGKTFETPTPFTQRAFAIQPATKSRPIAVVFPKDVQETYLAPYVLGGQRSLGGKRGMLVPAGAQTNAYGNLSKGQLARLKGKPNVFTGRIVTKSGKSLSGVWQRTPAKRTGKRGASSQPAQGGHLKLLIAFADTTPVRKHLAFYERAQAYLRRNAATEFNAAMRQALATARR